jgi:hypothetical protein
MASTSFDKMPRKLWEHPDRKSTVMWRFMQQANQKFNLNMQVSQAFELIACFPDNSDGICARIEANIARLVLQRALQLVM